MKNRMNSYFRKDGRVMYGPSDSAGGGRYQPGSGISETEAIPQDGFPASDMYAQGGGGPSVTEPILSGMGGGGTEPIPQGGGAASFGPLGPTSPVDDMSNPYVTTPIVDNGSQNQGFTTETDTGSSFGGMGVTEVVMGDFFPVVGWLVCIQGPDRGRSYTIHEQFNYIGRSPKMDIYLAGNDTSISRERHAVIAYDPEERIFFFAPADGRSLIRVNGKVVMTQHQLEAYDTLTIGKSRFKFVPFCGEAFSWDDEE